MNLSSSGSILVTTLHWVPNFGANLQAYATAQVFEKLGRKVVFANFRPPELETMFEQRVDATQREAHARFVDQRLEQSNLIRSQEDFERLVAETQPAILVTGSDAVFRLQPDSDRSDLRFPNPFWLGNQNASRPPKAAWAPSAMGCRYGRLDRKTIDGMKEALNGYALLSARDEWTKEQLKSLGVNQPISIVPDPVFLLRDEIRNTSRRAKQQANAPYIVVSSAKRLSSTWLSAFRKLANRHGLEVLAVPTPEGHVVEGGDSAVALPLDPKDWLSLVSNSSGYIGVRFHPTLIATVAGLPTVALDLYHNNLLDRKRSKTYQLLESFDCQQYCYGSWSHRFLRPGQALDAILEQQALKSEKMRHADAFHDIAYDYAKSICQL